MKHSTFLLFTLPSLSVMFLFIAIPIVSVFIQSLHIEHKQVIIVSENCDPFGCETTTSVDTEASAKLKEKALLVNLMDLKRIQTECILHLMK